MLGAPQKLRINKKINRVSSNVFETIGNAPTNFIADALEGKGVLDYRIKSIKPNMRIVGSAITADCSPGDNLGVLAALDYLQKDDVLMISTSENLNQAVIGDRVASVIKKSKANGIICDGLIRDLDDVLKIDIPCFCRGVTPRSAGSRGPGAVGIPINMGGQNVHTGDLVVADNDGVIVIPQEQISKMLSNLEKVLEKENEAQKIISDNPQKISMLKKRYPNIDEETEFLN